MTDMRRLWSKDVLSIEDKNYLVKLLSELQIVKWMPAKILTPGANRPLKDKVEEYRNIPTANAVEDHDVPVTASSEDTVDNNNSKISKQSQEALKKLFPTQEWVQKEIRYRQEISPIPSTRLEIALLRDGIRKRMIAANARVIGICPIRENLTMRCLDEMIRLSTINCADRGLFFAQIRDEMRMTLCCYKTLLSAAIDFGSQKFKNSLNATEDLSNELQRLKDEKERLRIENQEMRIRMKLMDRKFTEERNAIMESRKAKLGNLKRTIDQFIAMLETIGVEKHLYRHHL